MMDEKHKELLDLHRPKFVQAVHVERLYPILQGTEVLTSEDIAAIDQQQNRCAKVEKLLEILPKKGTQAFQTLCLALETTYPHLLTVMFLSGNQKPDSLTTSMSTATSMSTSMSTSLTSDSEEDALRSLCQDTESDTTMGNTDSSSGSGSSSMVLQHMSETEEDPRGHGAPRTYTRHIPSHEYDLSQNNVQLLKAELKLVTNDRDVLRDELQRLKIKMDGYKKLVMNEELKHGEKHSSRDYDWLNSQCEHAMSEIQSLKRQHGETMKKYDQAVKEAEFYRHKNKQMSDKLDQCNNDALALKSQFNDLLLEKTRLEQEVLGMQELRDEDKQEMETLRQQQRDVINENGSSEVLNKMYDTALDKYDSLKSDYDTLRKQFAELSANHSAAVSKFDMIQEQHMTLKKQYDDVCAERNGLKQQCTTFIRNWDNALRERNDLKETLNRVSQQKDDYLKEINQVIAVRLKATQDLTRLTEERNAAVQEYSLIMSERDNVHKEIEHLQEKLSETAKRCERSEKERKTFQDELESVRREITSSFHDRDRALKECNDLREKWGDIIYEKQEVLKQRDEVRKDYEILAQERDVARKERHEAIEHRDQILRESYQKALREKAEEKEYVHKEAEALRREIEKLHQELADAIQEAEVAKRRRDWAFSERDKIVLERESIRTLCDKLRRERDRAVTDLAEALRDSDELKKLKNDVVKELKEAKEKCELLIETQNRKPHFNTVSHNHSRDSAIDTDLQEWETETLEFDIGGTNESDLGFDIIGGKDDPQSPNDNSIFVSNVTKGGRADGKLKVHDQLIKVNNVDVTNVEKRIAIQAVKTGVGVITMVVRRRKLNTIKSMQPVHLNLADGKGVGLQFEHGLYVSRIIPGSAAAKEGSIAVGDRVLNINGRSTEKKSLKEISKLVDDSGDSLVMNLQKFIPTPQSSAASSNHNLVDSPCVSPKTPLSGDNSPMKASCWPAEDSNIKTLRSSGSQTDSLDSPRPRKTKGHDKENRLVLHHDNLLDRAYEKIFGKPRHKHDKDEKNKSRNTMSSVEEEEVIAELDSILQEYGPPAAKTSQRDCSDLELTEKEKDSGTWPKYRGANVEYSQQGTITITSPYKRKDRPCIPMENRTDNGYARVPPLPPERGNSSFAASIRHSPQGSDASVKYNTFVSSVSKSNPSKSSPYLSSPSQTQTSKTMPGKSNLDKSVSESNFQNHSRDTTHYPMVSSPDTSTDYSVSYSRDKDIFERYNRNNRKRPKSAPSKRHERRHPATHYSSDMVPQKPTTLNVYPTYSPRPLPHSGNQMISPSDPSRSAALQGSVARPSPPGYPSSSAADTAVMRSKNCMMYTANSQRVSPINTSPGQHPMSHRYSSPPGMAQYSSPPGYASPPGYLDSSIPEMETVRTEYHLHNDSRYSSTASPVPSQYSSSNGTECTTPTPSEDFPYSQIQQRNPYGRNHPQDVQQGCSTFPKRMHNERIRIPSNQSVTSSIGKISTSSIDEVSARSSPMSPFLPFEPNNNPSPVGSLPRALPEYGKPRKPTVGETRSIYVEKSSEPLGIQIEKGDNGGIFVSTVSDNSLARQAGLTVGHQLLEVCGLNMRNATYSQAAHILRQCGNSITMLVQFNPQNYFPSEYDEENVDDDASDNQTIPGPSLTNSPRLSRQNSHRVSSETITSTTPTNSPKQVLRKVLTPPKDKFMSCEPRFVFLKKPSDTASLGIGLVGGNAVGIFVNDVKKDSVASGPNGLRPGDQILEFNSVDLRSSTAEQAAYELSRPAETITLLVQYCYNKYVKIKDQPGDSFYVRVMFDKPADVEGELSFHKDDILYVENTVFNGEIGLWKAWVVDVVGNKLRCGTVPSKVRMEEAFELRRSISEAAMEEEMKGSRRASGYVRRSFFRRRRHQRNNSKDSRELSSYSDVSINSDSLAVLNDGTFLTYQRVEKLDHVLCRPVIILGPLAEAIINKLTSESPDKYCRCEHEQMKASIAMMEKGQSDGIFVDFKSRDTYFECITITAVKEIAKKNRHCMLDVCPSAIETLHRMQVYPIVLFCKHKSAKQIREVKDTRFLPEKLSNKVAKDYFDQFQRVEQDYKHAFSAVIVGGNLALMCMQIKSAIDTEQKNMIWVSSGSV